MGVVEVDYGFPALECSTEFSVSVEFADSLQEEVDEGRVESEYGWDGT